MHMYARLQKFSPLHVHYSLLSNIYVKVFIVSSTHLARCMSSFCEVTLSLNLFPLFLRTNSIY